MIVYPQGIELLTKPKSSTQQLGTHIFTKTSKKSASSSWVLAHILLSGKIAVQEYEINDVCNLRALISSHSSYFQRS